MARKVAILLGFTPKEEDVTDQMHAWYFDQIWKYSQTPDCE